MTDGIGLAALMSVMVPWPEIGNVMKRDMQSVLVLREKLQNR